MYIFIHYYILLLVKKNIILFIILVLTSTSVVTLHISDIWFSKRPILVFSVDKLL